MRTLELCNRLLSLAQGLLQALQARCTLVSVLLDGRLLELRRLDLLGRMSDLRVDGNKLRALFKAFQADTNKSIEGTARTRSSKSFCLTLSPFSCLVTSFCALT